MYVGAVLSAVGLVLAFSSHTARAIPIGNPHTAAYQEGVVFGRLSFGAVAAGLWLWMSRAVRRAKRWARVVSVVFYVSATALRGGPGDTSNECATGADQGQHVVVCGWSTDRSFGLLIQNSPGGTISELASAMMHMRPDLVRG
jgi:hypothetical protein